MIRHSAPTFGKEEGRAVARIVETGQISDPGSFERKLGHLLGRKTFAIQSGSAALHLALLSLGVRKGQRVALSTYTCAAVLNAVKYVGARPLFLDVGPDGNIQDIPDCVTIVPHMFGHPAPFGGPRMIEDFAMAVGSRKPRGPAIGSFYATKVMTTGHGGFITGCDVEDLLRYDNREDYKVRYNYRLSGLAAAVGEIQLKKLPEFIKRRRQIAEYYYRELDGSRVELPPRNRNHIFFRYVVRPKDADRLIRFLARRGVEAKRPVWRPLHTYFSGSRGKYRGAEELHRRAVSLPIYPSLTKEESSRVVEAVRAFPG